MPKTWSLTDPSFCGDHMLEPDDDGEVYECPRCSGKKGIVYLDDDGCQELWECDQCRGTGRIEIEPFTADDQRLHEAGL